MNAIAPFPAFAPDTGPCALASEQLRHRVVVAHFGERRWFYPGDTLVSDLGARIVAGALATCFARIWDLATEHIPHGDQPQHQPWLNRISDAEATLAQFAHGEDDETVEVERDIWERLDP